MPELEHRFTVIEGLLETYAEKLGAVEKRQNDLDKLVSSFQLLADREQRLESDVKEIKADVKGLVNKPVKRWDAAVTAIITAIAAGVIGFILAKFGM